MVAELVFWNPRRSEAAALLATGLSRTEVAEQVNVSDRTIYNWLENPEFAAEVDRLSVMVGIASRAQRLRYANRTLLNRVQEDGSLKSDRDSLDWLKYAQSETDGVKLDMSKLAQLEDTSGSGQGSPSPQGAVGPSGQALLGPATGSDNDNLDQQAPEPLDHALDGPLGQHAAATDDDNSLGPPST